ncbi:MAG: hypothetical protein JNK60_01940, partial [Acidobacteria bacterium]|nr:hypothetical protein [Acidobacteriota bacterium]
HVLALGIPTTLMGMSLPFLVRAMVRDGATAPGTIAILYGINVVGAAVGALVTPWVLIRHLGIPGAVLAGAGGSLVTGLVTLGLSFHPSWRSGESAEAPASRPVEPARAGAQGLGLWAALYGLSGFVALSLEIVWFRIADVAIKSAAFTFGSILFVYLGGLALGSLGGARRAAAREAPGVGPLGHPYRTFLLAIAGLLAYSGAIVWLLVELPSSSLGWFFTYWARYDGFGGLILREPGAFLRLYVLLPAVLYGPPTVLMGLAFAALHRAVQDDPRTSGRKVGLLQAANIGGCVAGSLLVGLVGLTHLGSAGTLRALLALGLVFCIAGLRAERGRARAPFAALAALLLLLTAGFPSTQRLWERLHGLEPGAANLVDEDATGVVVLAPEGAARWRLSTNGHGISWLPFGGVHTWLGALPALVHPAPRDVAIIGLGSGDTAWGSGVRAETSHVTVFEICAPQARLLRRLADGNPEDSSGLSALRSFLADGRMSFELADGRHALLREHRTYDVIELDALRPQAAYSGNLYSLEFYRLCASRLSPGGLMCTWAPTWRVHQTFRRVFPHVLELDGGQILVGSLEPIPMDTATWDARAVLAQPYLGTAQTEAVRQRLASARLCPEPVASESNLNRDLHPRDELVSPTGRSTLFAPGPGSGTTLHVPAVAHAAGAGGSLWRTDLDVRNPGPQTAEFELLLLKRDWDNTEPARRSYTAAAGQTVRLSDVLASAFGETGAAALRLVSGAKGLEVTSRTYNTASPEALGVSIPALGGPAMTTGGAARLDHLRQTAGGSRTNLGF